jgi:hypothetical protein
MKWIAKIRLPRDRQNVSLLQASRDPPVSFQWNAWLDHPFCRAAELVSILGAAAMVQIGIFIFADHANVPL